MSRSAAPSIPGTRRRPAEARSRPIFRIAANEIRFRHQTAKALGFEIPPTLLARADEVIE
jgi:hypothetical protein